MSKITKEYVMKNYESVCMNKYLFMFEFKEYEIEKFINCVTMKRLAMTQKLTDEFIEKYILNPDYHINDGDSSLTKDIVLLYQSFIKN